MAQAVALSAAAACSFVRCLASIRDCWEPGYLTFARSQQKPSTVVIIGVARRK